MTSASIASLTVYPVKSCRGVSLNAAQLTPSGLAWDREWVVVKSNNGRFCSQREMPKMALISVSLPEEVLAAGTMYRDDLPPNSKMTVTTFGNEALHIPLVPRLEHMQAREVAVWEWTGFGMDEGDQAANWFSSFLGCNCRLVRYMGKSRMPSAASAPALASHAAEKVSRPMDPEFAAGHEMSFADGFPVLLASEEDLADVNARLLQRGHGSIPMSRFRPNIVIKGAPAWSEDSCRTITIQTEQGSVELMSVKPCSRCKVPTVDPQTAEVGSEPLETLHTYRSGRSLGWTVKSWTHVVFFGTNLVITREACGHALHVGDHLALSGKQKAW